MLGRGKRRGRNEVKLAIVVSIVIYISKVRASIRVRSNNQFCQFRVSCIFVQHLMNNKDKMTLRLIEGLF